MGSYWTIEVGGVEKSFQACSVCDDYSATRSARGKDTLSLRTTERFDPGATQWSYLQHAVVRRDRASATGAAGTFSAGTVWFQGYFDDPVRTNDGGRESVSYL